VRDIETSDSELRLMAALRRRAARERGGPLPLIDVVDALLDERLRADRKLAALPGLVHYRGTGRVGLDRLDALLGCSLRL
jgi:hypothetical protein